METRANYVLIGAFTLAVAFGVFGFIYWFQSIGGSGERAFYRVQFEGSVSGLRTGASVLFNGIRVGEVTALKLSPERPQQVVATISIDKAVALRPDTAAGLEFQGLTGIAALTLKGGTPSLPPLVGDKANPPVLDASRAAAQDVTQAARDVLRHVDEFMQENQKSLHEAIDNISTFSAALARNSEHFDKIIEGIQNLVSGNDGKSGEVTQALRAIQNMSDTANRQLGTLSTDAKHTLGTINSAVKNIERNPSRLLFGGSSGAAPEKPKR
jgi:phospholipid/cholesterol/gamma-HCH transport system substrate-binding protein